MTRDIATAFPLLAALEPEAHRILDAGMRPVRLAAGVTVFAEGAPCEAFLLVLHGTVRVQKVAENGREIVLYRVEPGQTCILTTSCLLGHGVYSAEGVTETAVEGLALAPGTFRTLMAQSSRFRDFVFSAYATRISDLLLLIEEVAFGRIDVRLAQVLLERDDGTGTVRATHQDLATELGTAREVVSRQLKDFEHRGWVRLGRGRVTVKEAEALRGVVGPDGRRCTS